MNSIASIRKLYKPVQPAVKFEDEFIQYTEYFPSENLKPYIYCYWRLKTKKKLGNSYTYRVVSDGCIDIFFETKNPDVSFIIGFYRKYTEFEIGTTFDYFGIRFLPSTYTLLYQYNAKDLSNKSVELKSVNPVFASWLSSFKVNQYEIEESLRLFNEKFKARIEEHEIHIDIRFLDSLIEILRHNGAIDVENDLKTGLSSRQLRRVFNYYIGTTPKAFSNVVRFQYILNAKPSSQSLKENKIYYDVGFYDQAHFIKTFKTFYGVTPNKALE